MRHRKSDAAQVDVCIYDVAGMFILDKAACLTEPDSRKIHTDIYGF